MSLLHLGELEVELAMELSLEYGPFLAAIGEVSLDELPMEYSLEHGSFLASGGEVAITGLGLEFQS